MYYALSGLVIIRHVLPARPTGPRLLVLDGKNDEEVRRVTRGHPRNATGRHGGVQSRGHGVWSSPRCGKGARAPWPRREGTRGVDQRGVG